MADKHSQSQRLPPTSIRDQLEEKRQSFRNDERAESTGEKVAAIVILYLVVGLIGLVMFKAIGTGNTEICDDTGNFTETDCTGATAYRDGFWVFMGIVTVVFLLLLLAATGLVKIGKMKG